MRSWRSAALLVVLAALVACAADQVDPEMEAAIGAATTLDERPCPEDSFLSYENFGAPFVSNWCNGCHSSDLGVEARQGATAGIDFNDIESVRAHAERVWARAGDEHDTMPPVGDPDPLEREMLGEWLACGAPSDAELGQ